MLIAQRFLVQFIDDTSFELAFDICLVFTTRYKLIRANLVLIKISVHNLGLVSLSLRWNNNWRNLVLQLDIFPSTIITKPLVPNELG